MVLACVAMTDTPIVPHFVEELPFRYVLRLSVCRVRHVPYAAIPSIVPNSTNQSRPFMRTDAQRLSARLPSRRSSQERRGKLHARYESPALRATRHAHPLRPPSSLERG